MNHAAQRSAHDYLSLFDPGHLSLRLQSVSRPFEELATSVVAFLPLDSEDTVDCLRQLLQARDCALQAARSLPYEPTFEPPEDHVEDITEDPLALPTSEAPAE